MAEQPSRIQQIAQLTSQFPMSGAAKEEAIALALRDVDAAAIAAVHDALNVAIPVHAWNAEHTIYPALVAEHAVEQGRHDVVDSLARVLEHRRKLQPK